MTALPEFHTAAVKEARERIQRARAEVEAATAALYALDVLLAEATAKTQAA